MDKFAKAKETIARSLEAMVEAQMHLGHRERNAETKPFTYTQVKGKHIIDLIQTHERLQAVSEFLFHSASQGKTFLFVGTKQQATRVIKKTALQCDSFFVNKRWVGGMLTNWKQIKPSTTKLSSLEAEERSGNFKRLPKKEVAKCKKTMATLRRNIGGIKGMRSLPDVVIIVGQCEEMNAVRECQQLKIPIVTILDTNCHLHFADHFVPANDDSRNSLSFILDRFLQAIQTGQKRFRGEKHVTTKPRKTIPKTQKHRGEKLQDKPNVKNTLKSPPVTPFLRKPLRPQD